MAANNAFLSLEADNLEDLPAEVMQYLAYQLRALSIQDLGRLRQVSPAMNATLGLTDFDRGQQAAVEGFVKALELRSGMGMYLSLKRGFGIEDVTKEVVKDFVRTAGERTLEWFGPFKDRDVWNRVFSLILDMDLVPIGRDDEEGVRFTVEICTMLISDGPVEMLETLYTRKLASPRMLYAAFSYFDRPRSDVLLFLFSVPWDEESLRLGPSSPRFEEVATFLFSMASSPWIIEENGMAEIINSTLPFVVIECEEADAIMLTAVKLAPFSDLWFSILKQIEEYSSVFTDMSDEIAAEDGVRTLMTVANEDYDLEQSAWSRPMQVFDFVTSRDDFIFSSSLLAHAVKLSNQSMIKRIVLSPGLDETAIADGFVEGADLLSASIASTARLFPDADLEWLMNTPYAPWIVPFLLHKLSGFEWAESHVRFLLTVPNGLRDLSESGLEGRMVINAVSNQAYAPLQLLLDDLRIDLEVEGPSAISFIVKMLNWASERVLRRENIMSHAYQSVLPVSEEWLEEEDFGTGDLPPSVAKKQRMLGFLLTRESLPTQHKDYNPLEAATDLRTLQLLVYSGRFDFAFNNQSTLLNYVTYGFANDDQTEYEIFKLLMNQPGVEVTQEVLSVAQFRSGSFQRFLAELATPEDV